MSALVARGLMAACCFPADGAGLRPLILGSLGLMDGIDHACPEVHKAPPRLLLHRCKQDLVALRRAEHPDLHVLRVDGQQRAIRVKADVRHAGELRVDFHHHRRRREVHVPHLDAEVVASKEEAAPGGVQRGRLLRIVPELGIRLDHLAGLAVPFHEGRIPVLAPHTAREQPSPVGGERHVRAPLARGREIAEAARAVVPPYLNSAVSAGGENGIEVGDPVGAHAEDPVRVANQLIELVPARVPYLDEGVLASGNYNKPRRNVHGLDVVDGPAVRDDLDPGLERQARALEGVQVEDPRLLAGGEGNDEEVAVGRPRDAADGRGFGHVLRRRRDVEERVRVREHVQRDRSLRRARQEQHRAPRVEGEAGRHGVQPHAAGGRQREGVSGVDRAAAVVAPSPDLARAAAGASDAAGA
eukprot:CAMPEP_0177607934 /NCGR_PEP_ID=MMETSP0419_2-20121207/18190_1 /TAXON_ID=582737 /ORGANISM="Tetraselmis sp., Strain GSL018" /LENGTH=413 /DNA_ID=CAMNT_0019102565 /DNA_START=456 /DNA_END=1696 /DNA_ORIENTATION=+